MKSIKSLSIVGGLLSFIWVVLSLPVQVFAADHNDPNPINSIFSDIPINGADLYDFFGFPSNDMSNGESVVAALTFAPAPSAGEFDPDLLYRLLFDPDPRIARPSSEEHSLDTIINYAKAVDQKFLRFKAAEVRVKVKGDTASVGFLNFPGGDFNKSLQTNQVHEITSPTGHVIKVFIGARDDAFFNDLPGFFRSINYGPQFYLIPYAADYEERELEIPKTLLELEGNVLFNFDSGFPTHGQPDKLELPDNVSLKLNPTQYVKDANGNFRFVYSGKDAQAGININAIVLEMPLAFITPTPTTERIVNAWGESWVLKAADKIEAIADERSSWHVAWLVPIVIAILGLILLARGYNRKKSLVVLVLALVSAFLVQFLFSGPEVDLDSELEKYKLVDTDGVPFSDAALSERAHSRQLGANNLELSRHFVKRTAHLGWGFGPSIGALGLESSFDYGDATIPQNKVYKLATAAFPRVKKVLFQEINMPDSSWNPRGLDIPLKRGYEIFIPNVCAIDMDTSGTWPFGRRLEDQVATRFLSIFVDMEQRIGGQKFHVDSLGDQALWDSLPIEPKTPPNPLKNDKPFLQEFPYLAAPW